jgi:hypothetical protein
MSKKPQFKTKKPLGIQATGKPKLGKKVKGKVAPLMPITEAPIEDSACTAEQPVVVSTQPAIMPAAKSTTQQGERTVTLTLKGLDKRGRNAIYTGAAVSLRFPIGAFPDKTAPTSIEVSGVAGPKALRASRVKMTAEEKAAAKLARANAPKPTLAEKLAAGEARLAKLREKLAAGNEATM